MGEDTTLDRNDIGAREALTSADEPMEIQKTIYVKNIAANVTEDDIADLFSLNISPEKRASCTISLE